MLKLRPHILQYEVKSNGHEDENGDWHPGTSSFEGNIPCRYELNGKANTITFEDGSSYAYQYMVYLNQNCKSLSYGDTVRILKEGVVVCTKKVQGFNRGQLNAKLWL